MSDSGTELISGACWGARGAECLAACTWRPMKSLNHFLSPF